GPRGGGRPAAAFPFQPIQPPTISAHGPTLWPGRTFPSSNRSTSASVMAATAAGSQPAMARNTSLWSRSVISHGGLSHSGGRAGGGFRLPRSSRSSRRRLLWLIGVALQVLNPLRQVDQVTHPEGVRQDAEGGPAPRGRVPARQQLLQRVQGRAGQPL